MTKILINPLKYGQNLCFICYITFLRNNLTDFYLIGQNLQYSKRITKFRKIHPNDWWTNTQIRTWIASTRLPRPMTIMPELAKACEIFAPIPTLAPVTKATFPFHLSISNGCFTKLKVLLLFYDDCCFWFVLVLLSCWECSTMDFLASSDWKLYKMSYS